MKRACRRPPTHRNRRDGFTLMEVLLVLAILGVIMGLVLPNLLSSQKDANIKAAGVLVKSIEGATKIYAVHHQGEYPPTIEALLTNPSNDTNWKGPYLDNPTIPTDPWGSQIQYLYPGQNQSGMDKPDIFSLGPDKQQGTVDDIGNWKKTT